jgi:ABC-2 type transport system permease protein
MTALSVPTRAHQRRVAFGKIVQNEARLTLRRPVGLFAGVGIPLLLLIIFANIPTFRAAQAEFGGISPFDAYIPILAVFALAMLATLGLPVPLASYRELGVLRRLSTTPVSPSWLLAAQGVVQLSTALLALIIVFGGSILVFGASAPVSPAGLLLTIALTVAGTFPIGLTIAAVAKTAGAANVIGRIAFFPLIFFAGLWLPRALMPPILLDISNFSPFGAAVQAMQNSMLSGFPPVRPLLVLVCYGVLFSFLARRYFQWE